jgi:putative spermidine/putrescine transport system permease protein
MTRFTVFSLGRLMAMLAAALCVAPIVMLFLVSTSANWPLGVWAGGFTFDWLADSAVRLAPRLGVSLRIALITLLIDALIGLPAAFALARSSLGGNRLLQGLIQLPLGIPGIALGLALLLTFPTAKASGVLVLAAHALYTLPFFVGTVAPALAQPRLIESEQMAATLGASKLKQLLFITAPSIRGALIAAVVLVLTLSIGEFNITFFLTSALSQPLPVELYSAYITGRIETAAALTLWFIVLTLPAVFAIERLGGGRIGQV